jgi:hypothetical protein
LSFVFEVSNIRSGIDINTTQIILLIGLFLIKLERECGFSIGVEVGYVEIKLRASEGHDMRAIRVDEIRISHDFIFVELLHT